MRNGSLPNSPPSLGSLMARWHPTSRLLRLVVLGALVLLGVLGQATVASAHAELVATNPGDGTIVAEAPRSVQLEFSERVSLRPDGVRVLDDQGRRVDRGRASASGSTVTAPVRSKLAQGSYVVAWRAVSADGHPVHGAFTFSVGRESTLASGAAGDAFGSGGSDRPYEVAAAILRVLAYVSALGAAGYVVVGTALRAPGDSTPTSRLVVAASVVALVAIVAQIPLQAALATGRGLGAALDGAVLGLALADGQGIAALVSAVGLLAIVITAGLPFEGIARKVAVGGAGAAALGFAITGHTRTMTPPVLGFSADVAHLAAGAVWFGGLIAVLGAVRRARKAGDPHAAAGAIATFSGWGLVTSAVVVATGSALAWISVGGLEALTSTTYGRLLLAKVAAVAVVLVVAGWNRFRLLPRVAAAAIEEPPRDDAAAWRTLNGLVRSEVALIVVVLCLTGVLTHVTPARSAARSGPVTVTAPLGSGTVDVTIDPSRPGRNNIHAYVLTASGRPADRYKTATMRLSLKAEDIGPLDRTPVRAGPGHFQLVATELALAGDWDLTITVKPDRFTEQSATVTLPVR